MHVFSFLLFFTSALVWASAEDKNEPLSPCASRLIYATDDRSSLEKTIEARKPFYTKGLRDRWKDMPATFHVEEGEEILTIAGLEVMRGFEKPYMEKIAQVLSQRGGRVLNVGFGLGHIDEHIEQSRAHSPIGEHHIVELNGAVMERAKLWKASHPHHDSIFLHHGDWREVLVDFKARGLLFDAIAYDAFPLEVIELHRDFVPFIEEVIRLGLIRPQTGVLTFYLDSKDGLGKEFKSHLKQLGVGSIELEKVEVQLPSQGTQYWDKPFFFTPILSGIEYGS